MSGTCYHCGQHIPDGTDLSVAIDGTPREMCCLGCQAVAHSIVDSGLGDYYRNRDALPGSPREAMPEDLGNLLLYDHAEFQKSFFRALGENERGTDVRPAVPAFMTAASADVYRVVTVDGYEIKATEWHDFYTSRGKIKLKDLKPGDELLIQSGKGQFGERGSPELGLLLGLLTGDGHFTNRGKGQEAAVVNLWGADRGYADTVVAYINDLIAAVSDGPPSMDRSPRTSAGRAIARRKAIAAPVDCATSSARLTPS